MLDWIQSSLFISMTLVALAWMGSLLSGAPVQQGLGLARAQHPLTFGGLAFAVIGILILSHALDCLISFYGLRQQSALGLLDAQLQRTSGPQLALAAIALALAPAIGEEIFFRGLLLGGFTQIMGPSRALLTSSLLFGLAHLDVVQGASAAVLGLYLGFLTQRTGNVYAAIFCHAFNNGAAVLAVGLAKLS